MLLRLVTSQSMLTPLRYHFLVFSAQAQPVVQRGPVGVQAPDALFAHARVPLAGGAHGIRNESRG